MASYIPQRYAGVNDALAYDDVAGGQTYWFRKDHQGSTRWIGKVDEPLETGDWRYDAFGKVTGEGRSVSTPPVSVADAFNDARGTGLRSSWSPTEARSKWKHDGKGNARPGSGSEGLALGRWSTRDGSVVRAAAHRVAA